MSTPAPDTMHAYVQESVHVPRNVMPFLLNNPFAAHRNPTDVTTPPTENELALKAMLETHVREINGLITGWQFDPFMRTMANPTKYVEYVLTEQYGRRLEGVLHDWMAFYMEAKQHDYVPPVATMAFVEPDVTKTKAVAVWMGYGIYPLTTGNQAHGRSPAIALVPAIIKPRLVGEFVYNSPEALTVGQRLLDEWNAIPTPQPLEP